MHKNEQKCAKLPKNEIDILNEIEYNNNNKTSRTSVIHVSQGGYFFIGSNLYGFKRA